MTTNDSGLTYAEWYKLANAAAAEISGLTLDDMADCDARSAWEDDCPPEEFAHEVLEEEGFPFE